MSDNRALQVEDVVHNDQIIVDGQHHDREDHVQQELVLETGIRLPDDDAHLFVDAPQAVDSFMQAHFREDLVTVVVLRTDPQLEDVKDTNEFVGLKVIRERMSLALQRVEYYLLEARAHRGRDRPKSYFQQEEHKPGVMVHVIDVDAEGVTSVPGIFKLTKEYHGEVDNDDRQKTT